MEYILFRLIIAALIGLVIGSRFMYKDTIRVFALICVGASLITITSIEFFKVADFPWYSDPGRLAAQIISALGFLGVGLIWISDNNKVKGLSRSAALWLTAILGMLIGLGSNITIAVILFLVLLYFIWLNIVNKWK